MAQLGQTDDPKQLVPGDPAAVADMADKLRAKAAIMQDVADDLANVRIPDWSGQASSAFWDKFTPESGNWHLGHDAMTSAAKTLDSHSSSLSWAQGQAAEAIALWNRGEAATKAAMKDFQSHGGAFTTGPGGEPIPVGGSFTDPGTALRHQAQEVLDRAREQLAKAGKANASAIESQGGKGAGAPSWLAGPAQYVQKNGPQKVAYDIKSTDGWADRVKNGDKFARYHQWEHEFEKKKGPLVGTTLWGKTVEASLFSTGVKGATQLGDVTFAGQADAKLLGAEAGATAGTSGYNLAAQARANAYLFQGSVEGSGHWGIAEAGGSGKGYVGAEAGAQGTLGLDGVKVGADAFAGAKASGEAHADIGGVSQGVTGEAWAGAGAEANAQAGFDDGKLKVGGELGLGLGVGGKVGFEATVDPGEVKDTLSHAAGALNPFD